MSDKIISKVCAIVTGATGTNVNDLKLMLVFPEGGNYQSSKNNNIERGII